MKILRASTEHPNGTRAVLTTPAGKTTTHGTNTPPAGESHEWSSGPWKHPATSNPYEKCWLTTLQCWGLIIFVAILTAVSVGVTLSQTL